MFHFIWLSSLHYYTRIFYRNFLYIVVTPVVRPRNFWSLELFLHLKLLPILILGSDWACLADAQ